MIEYNERYGGHIYTIGNCRSSFYASNALDMEECERIDLSSGKEFELYRKQTVKQILQQISECKEISDKELLLCRDLPIFAVFIHYLSQKEVSFELSHLTENKDFGKWLVKRVKASLGSDVLSDLALLIGLFPLSEAIFEAEEWNDFDDLFDKLVDDGWIELSRDESTTQPAKWNTLHDILADQIILTHWESGKFNDRWIMKFLSLAACFDSIDSALLTLQRLADYKLMESVNWTIILEKCILKDLVKWQSAADILIRFSLLNPEQRISMLKDQPDIWTKKADSVSFQNSLGCL